MKKLALSLLSLALLVSVAHAATKEVLVKDDFFDPKRVTIEKGDKVTWRWRGEDEHNVALKKPGRTAIARASELQVNGKFTHKFRKVGTWRYMCENHEDDMRGKVIVKSP